MTPVAGFTFKPSGKFSTLYCKGFLPVAGILKRKGELGRTPKTFAPFILGADAGNGVKI